MGSVSWHGDSHGGVDWVSLKLCGLKPKKQTSDEVLNAWVSDIDSLLSLVEDTCQMINRENMVHGIKALIKSFN